MNVKLAQSSCPPLLSLSSFASAFEARVIECPLRMVVEVALASGASVAVNQVILSGEDSQLDEVFQVPVAFDWK